jgi:hypothetical protein
MINIEIINHFKITDSKDGNKKVNRKIHRNYELINI